MSAQEIIAGILMKFPDPLFGKGQKCRYQLIWYWRLHISQIQPSGTFTPSQKLFNAARLPFLLNVFWAVFFGPQHLLFCAFSIAVVRWGGVRLLQNLIKQHLIKSSGSCDGGLLNNENVSDDRGTSLGFQSMDSFMKYRSRELFYCPKSSTKYVYTLSTFY